MRPPAPMLAKERKDAFSDPKWTFEPKLDGIRVVAQIEKGATRLFSRNNIDITARFPLIAKTLGSSGLKQTFVDGEVIAYDQEGHPSFDRMLERYGINDSRLVAHADQVNPVDFFVFDVLYVDGKDIRNKSLRERRLVLEKLKIFTGPVKLIDTFPNDGGLLFEQALKLGLEGIMAKRLDSVYLSGMRTGDWLKIKALHTEEFVIGGYTGGAGARASTFGALLLGKWEDGKLRYVGTSGGGFTGKLLDEIMGMLKPIETRESPFTGKITADGPHHWVKPIYWAEVSFTAWTKAGRIRLPRFQRLRPDLTAIDPNAKQGLPAKPGSTVSRPVVNDPITGDQVASLAQVLESQGDTAVLRIDGNEIKFNGLNSVLWPATSTSNAITKRELVVYLVSAVSGFFRT